MRSPHGIIFCESGFHVRHRNREYGPFDYQWSADLRGIELHFQGCKFGEYCSENELYADLKEFHLPLSVVEVASIVLGCIVRGVVKGRSETDRREEIRAELDSRGYERFAEIDEGPAPPIDE